MATFEIRKAVTPDDIGGYRAVRLRVFVVEQQVPAEEEYDDLDAVAMHAVAVSEANIVIGTARLLPEEHGGARIGRMAVDQAWRRQGVGTALLRFLENEAFLQGHREVMLHAQLAAAGFYERYGYTPEGDVFLEANIEHVTMRKKLKR